MNTYQLTAQCRAILLDEHGLCILKSDGPWALINGYLCLSNKHPRHPGRGIHRFITNAAQGEFVDHINSDRLDNRQCNLRLCTHAENMRNRKLSKNNSSGYAGVYQDGKRWVAELKYKSERLRIGSFSSAEEAHEARQSKERELKDAFLPALRPDVPPPTAIVYLGDLKALPRSVARNAMTSQITYEMQRWPAASSCAYELHGAFADKSGVTWECRPFLMVPDGFGNLHSIPN